MIEKNILKDRIKEQEKEMMNKYNEMQKLKTLKDMIRKSRWDRTGGENLSSIDLRQEAIKWIKHTRKHIEGFPTPVENWIKTFFDITEEDLK